MNSKIIMTEGGKYISQRRICLFITECLKWTYNILESEKTKAEWELNYVAYFEYLSYIFHSSNVKIQFSQIKNLKLVGGGCLLFPDAQPQNNHAETVLVN